MSKSASMNWQFSRVAKNVLQRLSTVTDDSCIPINDRTVEHVYKILQRILKLIKERKLKLRNSPPFLQEILAESYKHIKLIFELSSSSDPMFDSLRDNLYMKLFLKHFFFKCDLVIKILKDKTTKGDIHNDTSACRRQLTKYTLTLSHLLADLRSIYPKGKFCGDNFKISKTEPAVFWKTTFGSRVVIPWDEFLEEFANVHPISSQEEGKALKCTIDLVENNHVSWFEFDVFTRLFQPWGQILNNWNVIVVRHPGYHAFMTYDEVNELLKEFVDKAGSFVFRLSCTRLGQWAIGYVNRENKIIQTIPQSKSLYQALIDGRRDQTYVYPRGGDFNPDITQHVVVSPQEHIAVSREQFELYAEMDSTFELCKICSERDKNVRINPCGHLVCDICLSQWRKTGGKVCPFCREDLRDVEKVVLEAYASAAQTSDLLEENSTVSDAEDDIYDEMLYGNFTQHVPDRPPLPNLDEIVYINSTADVPARPPLPNFQRNYSNDSDSTGDMSCRGSFSRPISFYDTADDAVSVAPPPLPSRSKSPICLRTTSRNSTSDVTRNLRNSFPMPPDRRSSATVLTSPIIVTCPICCIELTGLNNVEVNTHIDRCLSS